MASSETPVQGSLFNKVESVTTSMSITVLERGSRTGIYQIIL